MTPDVLILSRVDAESYQPSGTEACVSITDPGQSPATLSPRFADVLRMTFSDVPSMRLWKPDDVMFTDAHAAEILSFIARCRQVDRIVVHCTRGRSRSAGVALALCDVLGGATAALEQRFPDWNRLVRATLIEASRRAP